MLIEELKAKVLAVDQIYLDPNNPRFWSEATKHPVAEERVSHEAVQRRTGTEIDPFGVQDLYNGMLQNGFLLLDRIVVRPLRTTTGGFIIVEGNRRFRALTKLRADIQGGRVSSPDAVDEAVLRRFVERTGKIEVMVYEGNEPGDISWVFQGIRHISGIKTWAPAQRAKLVADQIDLHGSSISKAAQQFGMSAVEVGRLYRTHHALRQMSKDEEYRERARNDHFSLFNEVLKSTTLKNWLGWSESNKAFENVDSLRRLYSWISPCDEHDGQRRIHEPRQLKDVAYLVENRQESLLSEIDAFTLTVQAARAKAGESADKGQDWRKAMRATEEMLGKLPQSAIADDPDEFLRYLRKLEQVISDRIGLVEGVIEKIDAGQR
ncbi:hypothetical protein LU699_18035 [Luteimonas fraxinea]|uniref:hypothetical protein n=1 Tax=Luteimonas fraxinea TaxID=2901869 RepID=UPI001E2B7BE0|nr:hypothetical protein [Luteimonas fraxinea]UHH10125.1 hypothetical protein LU699_18035 [Luteimonas fraxinea]